MVSFYVHEDVALNSATKGILSVVPRALSCSFWIYMPIGGLSTGSNACLQAGSVYVLVVHTCSDSSFLSSLAIMPHTSGSTPKLLNLGCRHTPTAVPQIIAKLSAFWLES